MRRVVVIGLVAGGAGAALTALGATVDPVRAAHAWLVAWLYWLGLALGALGLLLVEQAARATWFVVLRRVIDAVAGALPVFVPLALPLALLAPELYPWARPEGALSEHARSLLEHRRPWLSPGFVGARALAYLGFWSFVAWRLRSWSSAQDASRDPALTLRQRRFASGALPFYGLTATFAAFDWIMSLETEWQSTMFGVYWFAGFFVAGVAAVIVLAAVSRARVPELRGSVGVPHWGALGRMLFAFTCFWAYIAFCQWMLVWVADLPDEVRWYAARSRGPWGAAGVFLALGHFALPFALLLPYGTKRRVAVLAPAAAWVLLTHWVDTAWLVLPQLGPGSDRPAGLDLAALVAVGGLAVAWAAWRAGRLPVLPVGDPDLPTSAGYAEP